MEFKRYPSIENSYQIKTVSHIIESEKSKQDWVVHEKIHGANFALYFNGTEAKAAKRNSFLEGGENFYSANKILDKYKEKLVKSFSNVSSEILHIVPNISYCILYGELYGGGVHPDLKEPNSHKMIQKEIFYRPDHDFIAFDLCVVFENEEEAFLPWPLFTKFCNSVDIEYPKILFKGSLQECLQYPNEFYPYNPFGLSELDKNVCEGTVIRPTNPFWLNNEKRAVLKNKNDKFMEIKKVKNKPIELPDSFVEWSNVANNFITENRLNNVLSKLGEITSMKQIGEVIKNFSQDWKDEFLEIYPDLKNYPQKDLKNIFREANTNGIKLIKEWFAKNV